jgi:hypothetical protein
VQEKGDGGLPKHIINLAVVQHPKNDDEIRTIQLGIIAHGRADTNHDAVVHRPHPILRDIDIERQR